MLWGWTHNWYGSSRVACNSQCKWYFKRYETSFSTESCEAIVITVLEFSCKHCQVFFLVMKENFWRIWKITSWLRENLEWLLVDWVWGKKKYMAIASAVFLTAKDVDFEKESALEDNSHVKRLIRFLSWLDQNLLNTCVDCCVGTWVSTCVSNCVRTWKSCSKNMKWIVNNSGVKKYQ